MISNYQRRQWVSHLISASTFLASLIAIVPLFFILFHILTKGIGSLNLDFFLHLPRPVGETGGGMANAIMGTLILIGLASCLGLPIGILGGVYLTEFGGKKSAALVRYFADLLNGTPSIVIGIFAYSLIVRPTKQFSALAGGFALGVMMIPIIIRTTETMLHLVPQTLREASLALGIPYWRTLISVVLKTAKAGIITGILLAVARVAGESAPLLFTALGNQFWSTKLNEPIAALPLQIFTYAISPFEDWQRQAWAGALILIALVLVINISSRLFFKQRRLRRS